DAAIVEDEVEHIDPKAAGAVAKSPVLAGGDLEHDGDGKNQRQLEVVALRPGCRRKVHDEGKRAQTQRFEPVDKVNKLRQKIHYDAWAGRRNRKGSMVWRTCWRRNDQIRPSR